jgi:hypothetical protein
VLPTLGEPIDAETFSLMEEALESEGVSAEELEPDPEPVRKFARSSRSATEYADDMIAQSGGIKQAMAKVERLLGQAGPETRDYLESVRLAIQLLLGRGKRVTRTRIHVSPQTGAVHESRGTLQR